MPLGRAFNTLLSLDYNLFILTVGIIGVGIYSIEDGKFKVFDSHARDVYGNSDPEGKCVLLEIPSIDNLVQYFQSLYRNQEIYELKGIHIYNFEENACSSNLLKDSSVLKNNNFVCSCKQCYALHAFNKSGRHLEFSMNDVIRGKIIHVAKMATKDESSVDVDFAVCSYKKECFYFISRGIFSLYNVFMGMLS